MSRHRRTREEILEAFKACAADLGRTPGKEELERRTGIKDSEVRYYWAKYSRLAQEAGLEANALTGRLDDEVVFRDYARVCGHLRRVPSNAELRVAQRELQTRTHTVYERYTGGIEEFHARFRLWLATAPPELRGILTFDGWREPRGKDDGEVPAPELFQQHPGLRPFLPSMLQHLQVLARGERPPHEAIDLAVNTLFERRIADAFRCLGFEMQQLGQGMGRKADSLV